MSDKPTWSERRPLHLSVTASADEVLRAVAEATGIPISRVVDGILTCIPARQLADAARQGVDVEEAAERAYGR